MREIQKHNKVYDDILGVMNYIKENTPDKKIEKTERVNDDNGKEKEIIYSIIDKRDALHRFVITPEGDKFKLSYVSIGEYPEYVADDLDFI